MTSEWHSVTSPSRLEINMEKIFTQLKMQSETYLGQIAAIMHSIDQVSVNEQIAKFTMYSTKNGVQVSHYVEFLRDSDGVWRLSFY